MGSLSAPQPGNGPYRPAAWHQPAQTAITVPGTVQPPLPGPPDMFGNPTAPTAAFQDPPTVYVFDAILHAEHAHELRRTEHPVQTGANITDHAYKLPARVVLEIGMSDAMDSYQPNGWESASSKSVAAFQTLLDLQRSRQLVTLTTRLATYENMLVESVSATDTSKTLYGLRATVTFSEIFLATATATSSGIVSGDIIDGTASGRPAATVQSAAGTAQAQPVPGAIEKQNNVAATSYPNVPSMPAIPGAGSWSSFPVSSLSKLFS